MHFYPRSLKFRIAGTIFVLEAVMMALVLGITLSSYLDSNREQSRVGEEVLLNLLSDLSRTALFTTEYDQLQPFIEQVIANPQVLRVMVMDHRGVAVVSSDVSDVGQQNPTLTDEPTRFWRQRTVANASGKLGTVAIRYSHTDLIEANAQARAQGIQVAALGMLLIAVVGILSGWFLTRRLDVLANAARRIADGELRAATNLRGDDEVAIVGRAFDRMARNIERTVTELHQSQHELRQTYGELEQRIEARTRELAEARDEALEANRVKSAFLANMSHEIRTPLTAIIGFSDTLLDSNQNIEQRVEAINTVNRAGRHLLQVINNILDLSKIEAGRLEVERMPLSLFEVLADVTCPLARQAADKGIEFHTAWCFPLPREIQSDAVRIKQILFNLLGNAIKFTDTGRVTLRVSYLAHEQQVAFNVIDTGVGIKPELVEKLFEPFSQADSSTTRRFGGTGLGLHLSLLLARHLGGSIEMDSRPGAGSHFRCLIDVGVTDVADLELLYEAPQACIQAERAAPTPTAIMAGQVLVVEDNLDNQRLICTYLRCMGIICEVAENGELGVTLAAQGRFDVVLMDMQMPVMDGLAATRALRARGYHGPIIALTANAMTSNVEECRAAGCDDFLSKPINRDDFVRTVGRYLAPVQGRGTSEPLPSRLLESEPEMADLVEKFVARLGPVVADIERLVGEGAWDELRRKVHDLKGTGGSYGYPALSTLAGRFEFELAKQAYDTVPPLLGDLKSLAQRIARGIQATV